MKKYILILSAAVLMLSMLAGCTMTFTPDGIKKDDTAGITDGTKQADAADITEAAGKTILPISSALDIDHLDNISVTAGFTAKDIYLEGGSRLVIRMTVYDAQVFEADAIAALKAGDILSVSGKSIAVETVAQGGDGSILINGGVDKGGITLSASDSGNYAALGENERYFAVGEVTLPVAQEFIFHDCSNITQPEIIRYPGELITDIANSDRIFAPDSTTVTIGDGQITELTVVSIG